MEYIVAIGCRCQQIKNPVLQITDGEDLEYMLNVEDGGEAILEALVASGLVDPEGGNYTCLFFIEMNNQLISNWRNGAIRATQSNSNEEKTKQGNSIQCNSTQPDAMALPKHCLSTASKSKKSKSHLDFSDPELYPHKPKSK